MIKKIWYIRKNANPKIKAFFISCFQKVSLSENVFSHLFFDFFYIFGRCPLLGQLFLFTMYSTVYEALCPLLLLLLLLQAAQ